VVALHLRPMSRFTESMHGEEPAEDDPLVAVDEAAASSGVAVRTMAFPSALPSEDILRVAEELDARWIVLGAHRSILRGETLGGPIGAILKGAQADVLVLVDRGVGMLRTAAVVRGNGVHAAATERIAERLRASGVTVDVLPTDGTGAGYDLVVAPLGTELPDELACSWALVAAGGA
jgi:hypothetical protein